MTELSPRIRAVLELDPAADAVQFEGTWRPWSSLATTLATLEDLLAAAGVGVDVPVAVMLRNRPETHAVLVAIVAADRTLLMLNPAQPDAVVAADIERLRPAVVVASAVDWDRPGVADAARAVGAMGVVVVDAEAPRLVAGLERPSAAEHHGPVPGVAVQMLTSGTTGPAKRVPLPYANVEAAIDSAAHYFGQEAAPPRLRRSVQIVWAPMVHISGLWAAITAAAEGRRISLLERFKVDQWVATVREHRPRITSLPPTPMRMVMEADVSKDDLASLQAVRAGTAPMPPELMAAFEERYGIPVLPAYGATEFAGAVAGWTLEDHEQFGQTKRGSVGRPQPDIEVRVVDPETGAVLSAGEQGVLQVRGPQVGPEFVQTTDLAVIDEDGFVWMRGRSDDVIIRGGFKVPTTAVANALRTHPKVADAAVVGIADERLGMVPVAAVELVAGETVTPEELKEHLRDLVTSYQLPVELRIVDHLPRTVSFKVSQTAVRDLFEKA